MVFGDKDIQFKATDLSIFTPNTTDLENGIWYYKIKECMVRKMDPEWKRVQMP